MKGRLVFGVIVSLELGVAGKAGAQIPDPIPYPEPFQNSASVAILGCRREVATQVRKERPFADSVIFTLYPQVFPRTPLETDLLDFGQYFDHVQRVWVPFNFSCTYNYQSSVARILMTWAGSP